MLFVLSYLASFATLTVCFLISGLLVERWLLGPRDLVGIRFVGQISLGAGLWIVLLFLYSSIGLLSRSVILATLVALVLVLLVMRQPISVLLDRGSPRRSSTEYRAASALLGFVLISLLLVLFVQTLWPKVSWDANVYHLTVPRLYLEHQGFWRIPFNVYSNWPLNTELLFAMAMAVKSHVLAKLVHFGFGCLCTVLVYQVARDAADTWTGYVAAVLLLVNPIVLLEIRVAYVDLASALFFTLAFLLVHRWLERSDGTYRLLVVAGLFAGLAAGTKLTGIVGGVCLALLLASVLLKRRVAISAVFRPVARLMVPTVVLLTPWLVKSWILTGNPVYPFLFSVFGGPEWSSELQRQLTSWQQSIGMGRSATDYLLLPARVILEGGRGYDRFDGEISRLWIVLIPLSIWIARRRTIVARGLIVSAIYFVFWALSSQQIRFLIPVLPILAISGAIAISDAIGRFRSYLATTTAVWASSLTLVACLTWAGWDFAVTSVGMARDYLHFGVGIEQLAEEPVYRFINEELPIDARVLMLNTNHGYFCRRAFIADSFFEASQIAALLNQADSKGEIAGLLQGLGITHLLIENRARGIPYPDALPPFLNDPELVRSIYRSPDERFDIAHFVGGLESPGFPATP